MLYITEVHLVGGTNHEHIASVRWQNASGGPVQESARAAMVDWLIG